MASYDLIVIGGGPAGYVAAIRAARYGKKVALIEREKLGGTCLNWGCIPTKAMHRTAYLFSQLQQLAHFGIQVGQIELDFQRVMARKSEVAAALGKGIQQLMQANKIEVYHGTAELIGNREVLINGLVLQASYILIATGSKAAEISLPGASLPNVLNSNSILELSRLPASIAIIGGGVIGIEFASIFAAFGTKVAVIEMSERILPEMDEEISKRLAGMLKRKGIDLYTSAKVGAIRGASPLMVDFVVRVEPKTVSATHVLLATGRSPEFGGLNLDEQGIRYDTKRGIAVDACMQTSSEAIYAAGDVTGGIMLAHVASHEALVAVDHMFGECERLPYEAVPACIFSLPEIAMVGLTEQAAKERGIDIAVSKFPFAANGKALVMGEPEGLVKMIARKQDHVIIGVHMIGSHATDLIQEGVLAIKMGLTSEQLAATIHPHPTMIEVLHEAALGIHGQMIHYATGSK
ncbi:dihydrolipoyl dehydrogenase [Paenibacillus cymbidii]|uniref:dihydrolipoyl dehydrogenase n=1 Tax=Paenibacillus cymbidii TaxID=1639034 RepID=UPI001436879E|nr:dihydrolipoyl dehydrogenase [Paenibacillus cymbidii]